MADPALDHFGQFLMRNLRDRALECYDALIKGQGKAPALRQLKGDLAVLSPDARLVARRALVECLDGAIHDFLFALQEQAHFENRIKLLVDDVDVIAASDGIHGEPYGQDGWFA